MRQIKQGTVVIALAASLGLVVPSSFGASVAADKGGNVSVTTLRCDLDGDGDNEPYTVETTDAAASWRDVNSSTVFRMISAHAEGDYTAVDPITLEPLVPLQVFHLTDDWGLGNSFPQANKKGKQARAVECTSPGEEYWLSDGSIEGSVAGVLYHGVLENTWQVTVSGNGDLAAQSADRQPANKNKSKHKKGGNHRGHGKRGR